MNTFARCAITVTLLTAAAHGAEFPGGMAYVGTATGIVKLDLATGVGAPLAALSGQSVRGMSFGPDGRLYVAVPDEARIAIVDATGVEVDSFAMPGSIAPNGVEFVADGAMYVPNQLGGVAAFNADGSYLSYFGIGNEPIQAIAIGTDGHLFIALAGANKLVEHDPCTKLLTASSTQYYGATLLNTIARGPGGNLFMTRVDGTKVFVVDTTGAFVASATLPNFGSTYGIAFGPDGRLFVAGAGVVSVLDPSSLTAVKTLLAGAGLEPRSIAFAPYRFHAKLKGQLRQPGIPPRKVSESVVLSLAPGSRRTMIQLSDDVAATLDLASAFGSPRLVFHGFDEDVGTNRTIHGASVPAHATKHATSSLVLDVKGSIDAESGAFRPKVAKGSFSRMGAAGVFRGQLVTKGLLK